MRTLIVAVSVVLLLAGTARAQTSPTCTQLPSLACVSGDTYSGTHDFSSATISLPAAAVDAINEIHSNLKSGLDGTLITGTATSGQCAEFNGDGDIVGAGAACGSGAGDITDVFDCATGDCASIVVGATDLLDFSGNDASTATEGLILPQHATACAGGTADGQPCWENDANILHIGDGTGLQDFPPAGSISGDITMTGTGAVTIADNAVDGTDIQLGSDATGDIMYYSAGGDYVRLGIGAANEVLRVASGLPDWQDIADVIDAGALANVLVWNEKVCLTADCVGADDPCDCCTGAGAGCSASTYTLAATPRSDCDAFGAGGTISAWCNGIQQKCVAASPGINEFALAGAVVTPNANSSVMYVSYEQ